MGETKMPRFEELSRDTLEASVAELVRAANQARPTVLASVMRLHAASERTLHQERERLAKELGQDAPRVHALTARLEDARSLTAGLKELQKQEKKRSAVERDQWLIFGRVFDASGNGLPGLCVQPFVKEEDFSPQLGRTQTGAEGEFALRYSMTQLRPLIERPAIVFVSVLSGAGWLIASSEEGVTVQPGSAEYFELCIPCPPNRSEKPQDKPTPPRRSGKAGPKEGPPAR
jgi:hypothetical protein